VAVRGAFDAAAGRAGIACGFKNTGLGMGHPDVGRCRLQVAADHVELLSGAASVGQGIETVLTQIACQVLGLEPRQVVVRAPDTASTPDSGTTTASRQTLITGEACRKACEAAWEAALSLDAEPVGDFPLSAIAGQEFLGQFEAVTDSFESAVSDPVRHVAYSYACQLVVLGADGRIQRVVAAHDSGLVVNPVAFEGQVEGGVAMGLGYALTEHLALEKGEPVGGFGRLGLLRSVDVPPIQVIPVRKAGAGSALDGGVSGAAFGAKGIGEISSIPTAAAVAGAYHAADGTLRDRLPLRATPYARPNTDRPAGHSTDTVDR
jgi:aldehyde oxidoreductase